VGSDKEVTITQLAEAVKRVSGSSSAIEYVPYDRAYGEGFEDMSRRVPDLGKIRSFIGYQPRIDLDGIIQSVIEHLKR
jgi:UDP-glucose 4-epimerase